MELRIQRFFGINTKTSDVDIAIGESYGLTNCNLTEEALEKRRGSAYISGNVFTDSGANPVPITGLFEGLLNGVTRQVGTGGDQFQEFDGVQWVNQTGTITITSNPNNQFTFSQFVDNAGDQVFIMANGVDAPFKWDGTGAAAAMLSTPGNFKFQVVRKNKLWVSVDDFLYWSDILNGEVWNLARDVAVFANKGGPISGLVDYVDRLVVFSPRAINVVSGSSDRDLFIEEVVTGEGCVSGFTPQVITSSRYGTIIVFLANDGTFKGFNGSKNLIKLGEDAERPLFSSMNNTRWGRAVSANYLPRNQYWLALTYGSGLVNDEVVLYDYYNDNHSHPDTGRPLSTILNHNSAGTGMQINAAAMWNYRGTPVLVTGDYDGQLVRQDVGNDDADGSSIEMNWLSGKIAFNTPTHVKLLYDANILTTQYSRTDLDIVLLTENIRADSTTTIEVNPNSRWGTAIWGTGRWAAASPRYTRMEFNITDGLADAGFFGRYIQFQLLNDISNQRVKLEEFILTVEDLGDQAEYIET
jgi:hypothetical protein